jgi:hypothetical protein
MMTLTSLRGKALLLLALSNFSASAFDLPQELRMPRPAQTAPAKAPAVAAIEVPPPPTEIFSTDEPLNQVESQPEVSGSLSLKDAGILDGLRLDGHQPQSGFTFTLPGDRVVVKAQLLLKIHVSSALVDGQHYLNVMLNGQPLAQLPLSQASDDVTSFSLDIPAPMLVSTNSLSVSLENGKTLQCEADSDRRYRLTIQPDSRIEYQGLRLDTAPDLSRFPWPFIDPLEMGRQQVAIAFTRAPSQDILSAASLVSSFLGYHADYKDINLPVSLGELPQSNAIVFAHPGDAIGGLQIPQEKGGSLRITDNPLNPVYKLLVVSGQNLDELKRAAYALTHAKLPTGGKLAAIPAQRIPARQPYDAPRWVDTHRPVALSTLVADDARLSVHGLSHETIRVAFRAAPDLFLWDGDTIPVHLGYRFPSNGWVDDDASALGVSLNGRFLRNLPVNKTGAIERLWHKAGGDTRQEQKNLHVQPWQIYGDNQFEFYFAVKAKQDAPCQALNDNSIKSSIDPNSTLDLSHTWHFSELPNLAYFVGAGFPFSRQADLSQTLVLMAAHPTATEISTLLTLMARQGNATGVTSHGARVLLGDDVLQHGKPALLDKDVLVIATLQQRALMRSLLANSPFDLQEGQLDVRPLDYLRQAKAFLLGDWHQQSKVAARYLASANDWRGFVSFRSPWAAKRSVILATATQDGQLARLPDDLRKPAVNAAIRGDIAVIGQSDGVHSWHVGSRYVSGQMPWYLQIFWYASQHFLVLGLMCALLATLLGLSLYVYLGNQSEKRLANYVGQRRKNGKK